MHTYTHKFIKKKKHKQDKFFNKLFPEHIFIPGETIKHVFFSQVLWEEKVIENFQQDKLSFSNALHAVTNMSLQKLFYPESIISNVNNKTMKQLFLCMEKKKVSDIIIYLYKLERKQQQNLPEHYLKAICYKIFFWIIQ